MTNQFRIGNIDDIFCSDSCWSGIEGQKFIIEKDADSLVYHAHSANLSADRPNHIEIARRFNILETEIVGGGSVSLNGNILTLFGASSYFGGIPSGVMEYFRGELTERYLAIKPVISKIEISTQYHGNFSAEKWMDYYGINLGETK